MIPRDLSSCVLKYELDKADGIHYDFGIAHENISSNTQWTLVTGMYVQDTLKLIE